MSSSQCTSSQTDCNDGDQSSWVQSSATATVFVGAILGQLTMGYAGDMLGRNAAMTLTLSLVAIGAIGSAAFSWGNPTAVYITIIVCRFFLGIGVGGVYPLSATKVGFTIRLLTCLNSICGLFRLLRMVVIITATSTLPLLRGPSSGRFLARWCPGCWPTF